jgi:hypothetical protein
MMHPDDHEKAMALMKIGAALIIVILAFKCGRYAYLIYSST